MNVEAIKQELSPYKWRLISAIRPVRQVRANGANARLHTRERIAHRQAIRLHGEREGITWFVDGLEAEDHVWDLGAHRGTISLLAADAGATVDAVEADPAMVTRLQENLKLNAELADRITIRPIAITGEPEEYDTSTHNRWISEPGRPDARVGINPIQLAAVGGYPTAIKCDIEGAEAHVLPALKRQGILEGVDQIYITAHYGKDVEHGAVRKILTEAGFRIDHRAPGTDTSTIYGATREGSR